MYLRRLVAINKSRLFLVVLGLLASLLCSCILKEPQLGEFPDLRGDVLLCRFESIKRMDLTKHYPILIQATFDTRTKWPGKDKMPENFVPAEILELGKNPGLGIRALHKIGITGQDVNVAIIDQPLRTGHVEYKDRVKTNNEIGCKGRRADMHGAAIASILVGETCGVAPGAYLHYWAVPAGIEDYATRIEALDQIMAYNEDKPLEEQIRVVSVALGYMFSFVNLKNWQEKLMEAEEKGLIVVHCGQEGDKIFSGVRCPIYADREDSDSYGLSYHIFGETAVNIKSQGFLFVPTDNRTQAGYRGNREYFFSAQGGLSWGAPFLAGVITLGLQVNPHLTEAEIYQYLRETGTPFMGGHIVNPQSFIQKIKEAV